VRVVSLVPSATETLVALGVDPIACTRFCEQDGIPTVGGTKDPRVDEIVALAPDLVVMNQEENRIEDADALLRVGLAVHSMSPVSVSDVGPAVSSLARRVGVRAPSPFAAAEWHDFVQKAGQSFRGRVVVLIWRRPWMTINGATYGTSLLSLLGWRNAVAGITNHPIKDRYPEATLEQLAGFAPELVLLPTEPYPFSDRQLAEVGAAFPTARVALVDGQDLFWWGIRTPDALDRLSRNDW
jgi:ABC-type Fe3+-hydroxamate transport system substrate-binding protein